MIARTEMKAVAKEQIRGNLVALLVCSVIPVVVTAWIGLLPSIGPFIAQIIAPAFSMSVVMIYLGLSYGEKPQAPDAFLGFSIFGKSLWMYIVMEFFIALWAILFIIPGIWKAFGYAMAPYVLAENPEMSAMGALKESERIMKGNKMDLFMLVVSFLGWIFLTAITLGIAGIYTIPYMQATMTQYYYAVRDAAEEEV